jgi:hypothetical protein
VDWEWVVCVVVVPGMPGMGMGEAGATVVSSVVVDVVCGGSLQAAKAEMPESMAAASRMRFMLRILI